MIGAGRNSGVTGYVDIQGTPAFTVKVYTFQDVTEASTTDTTGRGSGSFDTSIGGIDSGTLLLRGKVQRKGYPAPANLRNASGSITLTYDVSGNTPVTKTQTIRILRCEFLFNIKDEANWDVTITAQRTGNTAYTGWGGDQITPSEPAAGNSLLYPGSTKLIDANKISEDSIQRIAVWGLSADTDAAEITSVSATLAIYATPPQTSEKVFNTSFERINSVSGIVTITWRLSDTLDEVQLPLTISDRSAQEPWTDMVCAVVACASTDAVADLATNYWNAFQSADFAYKVTLTKINPIRARVLYFYRNPGVLVNGYTSGQIENVRAYCDGSTVYVFVKDAIQIASGVYHIFLAESRQIVSVRRFRVHRQYTGSTIEDQQSLLGHTNDATFLGIGAGKVLYEGAEYETNIGLTYPGNYPIGIVYNFREEEVVLSDGSTYSNLFMLDGWLSDFRSSAGGGGWVDATTYGMTVGLPTQSNFDVFIGTLP